MPEQLDVAIVGAGPVRALRRRASARRTRPGLRRADAHLADPHAAGHAAPVGLGGDVALGSEQRRHDRRLGARGGRGPSEPDPAANVPPLCRLVPRPVRTRERSEQRGRARSRRQHLPALDRRRARSSTPARSCSPWASPPSPTRRRRFARCWATGPLRDRSAGLRRSRRPTGDRRRRWPGRAGERSAGRPLGRGGRVDPPIEAALVRGTRAVHAARAGPATPLPSRLSGRRLRPATPQPARPAPRIVRLRAETAAPAARAQDPPRGRIALAARSGRRQGPDHGGANRHDADAEWPRSATRPQRRVREGGGRRDPLDRVPLLPRPSVLSCRRRFAPASSCETAGPSSTARSAPAIRICSSWATPPKTASDPSPASCRVPGSLHPGSVKGSPRRPTSVVRVPALTA